jgi:hypothetical protein
MERYCGRRTYLEHLGNTALEVIATVIRATQPTKLFKDAQRPTGRTVRINTCFVTLELPVIIPWGALMS